MRIFSHHWANQHGNLSWSEVSHRPLPSPSAVFFLVLLIFFLKTLVKYSANLLLSPSEVINVANRAFSFSASFSMSFFLTSSLACTSVTCRSSSDTWNDNNRGTCHFWTLSLDWSVPLDWISLSQSDWRSFLVPWSACPVSPVVWLPLCQQSRSLASQNPSATTALGTMSLACGAIVTPSIDWYQIILHFSSNGVDASQHCYSLFAVYWISRWHCHES